MALSSAPTESNSEAASSAPLARPATSLVAGPEDETLTIAQAAKLRGVSQATLYRRVDDGLLHAEREGRSLRVSRREVIEIGPLVKREPKPDRTSARGELAARLYPLLEQGTPLDVCVIQLAADPDEVRKLAVSWVQLREWSARFLAPPASPVAPQFDHPPSDTWTCCPGHQAMKRMEKTK